MPATRCSTAAAQAAALATWVVNAGNLCNFLTGPQAISLGALSGGGGNLGNNVGNSQVTYTVGALNSNTTYSGNIVDSVGGGGTTALVKTGSGTLALAVANTYSGGTQINGGVLNFASGSLPSSGISFGGGTLQWATGNTQDVSAGILPIPAGKAASLDTNGNNVTLASSLNGGGGLTKIGAGTLTLNATASYAGPTSIAGGTLRVGGVATNPVTANLLYDLDASNAANYTVGSGGNVTQWNDISGNGNNFIVASGATGPTVLAAGSGINGLGALHFNGTQQLVLPNATSPETVFIIDRVTNYNGNLDGIWGQTGTDPNTQYDFGIREYGSGFWQYASGNGNDYVNPSTGSMYINGVQVASTANGAYTLDAAQLLEASNASPGSWEETGLGEYGTIYAGGRYFTGDIGEVMAYNSVLSASDMQLVQSYLMSKWLGIGSAGVPGNNILPATTPVVISNGGTFDMTNGTQTIASLSSTDGMGSMVLLGSGVLTVGDATNTTFDGVISGTGGGADQARGRHADVLRQQHL